MPRFKVGDILMIRYAMRDRWYTRLLKVLDFVDANTTYVALVVKSEIASLEGITSTFDTDVVDADFDLATQVHVAEELQSVIEEG